MAPDLSSLNIRRRKVNKSRERASFESMWNRCRNGNHYSYHRYGGRGITVCDRWKSFDHFLTDMGPRPLDCTLDRIDGDGNYEPSNCRWATSRQQAANKAGVTQIVIDGVSRIGSEWSEVSGIPANVIAGRIHNGWEHRQAVFSPLRERKINLKTAIELHRGGASLREIGVRFGATPHAVHLLLKRHGHIVVAST